MYCIAILKPLARKGFGAETKCHALPSGVSSASADRGCSTKAAVVVVAVALC